MPTVYHDAYHVSPATRISNTTETTCYTAPGDKWAYVQQIMISDIRGYERKATIRVYKGGTGYVLGGYERKVCANGGYDKTFEAIHLAPAEYITVTMDRASTSADVFIFALENAQPRI